MAKLFLIGIGFKALSVADRARLVAIRRILAPSRLAEVFAGYPEYEELRGKLEIIDTVDDTLDQIRQGLAAEEDIVLLASGDPLFFGIGRKCLEVFGRDAVVVSPDLSSVQVAFARIGETWEDAFFVSLHGSRGRGNFQTGSKGAGRRRLELAGLPAIVSRHRLVCALTDRENNPARIAGLLAESPLIAGCTLFVCERLGRKDERVVQGTPAEIAAQTFMEPNLVVIRRETAQTPPSPVFGLREEEFAHEAGLITKDEVRAVTLHRLRLPSRGVLWDIGAGSGSVSVEAARLAPGLTVYAVEKNKERLSDIKANCRAHGVYNVHAVNGEAMEILANLPAPDRVFVGGGGAGLPAILDAAALALALGGLVVVNAVTLETLHEASTVLAGRGFAVEVIELNVSRSAPVGGRLRLAALNPVFIVVGERLLR